MTLLDVVLTPGAAWVLTDSAACAPEPGTAMASGATSDPALAARSAFASRPPGPPALRVADVDKLLTLPRARLAAFGTSSWWVMRAWHGLLRAADPAGIGEVLDAAPAWLREILAACPDPPPVAYSLGSADGFEPSPLPDGHALGPTVSTGDADYPELYRLAGRVGEGREAAEAFLLAAAANQLRSFRAGLYGGGMALGGPLRLAEVTERGVECREVGEA